MSWSRTHTGLGCEAVPPLGAGLGALQYLMTSHAHRPQPKADVQWGWGRLGVVPRTSLLFFSGKRVSQRPLSWEFSQNLWPERPAPLLPSLATVCLFHPLSDWGQLVSPTTRLQDFSDLSCFSLSTPPPNLSISSLLSTPLLDPYQPFTVP